MSGRAKRDNVFHYNTMTKLENEGGGAEEKRKGLMSEYAIYPEYQLAGVVFHSRF